MKLLLSTRGFVKRGIVIYAERAVILTALFRTLLIIWKKTGGGYYHVAKNIGEGDGCDDAASGSRTGRKIE